MSAGECLFNEYRARHLDVAPARHSLPTLARHAWEAWAKKGGSIQTGVILQRRPNDA